jgi:hypothetical protein
MKKFLITFVVVILALAATVWFGAPGLADYQLRKMLAKADTASYSYLELDLWEGNVVVHDIFLRDSSGVISTQPLHVALNRLAIKGLDVWRLYKTKELHIDSLALGKGYLKLPLYKNDKGHAAADTIAADTSQAPPPNPAVSLLSLHHVAIDSIGIFLALNPKNAKDKYAGTLSIQGDSILVPFHDISDIYFREATFKVRHVTVRQPKKVAFYTLDSLVVNDEKNTADIYGFKLKQRISRYRYGAYFNSDKAYGTVDVPHIAIKGLPTLHKGLNAGLHLTKITAYDPQGYIYKNHRYPHTTNPKPFIIEMLFKIGFPITVDTVDIVDGQLLFNENWREDYVPGNINLTQLNVRMLNYTNAPTKKASWTMIVGTFTLFDKLEIDVDWRFDLAKKGKAFTLDLRIGQSPFAILNPFTENTFGARFIKGDIQGGHMRVEGDNKSGGGTLDMFYTDMNLELLDRQNHEKNFWQWAGGGLANTAVRNNNERHNTPKQGICYKEPVEDRAIFGYVVNLFFSGFQDIALGSKNRKALALRGMNYLPMPKTVQEVVAKNEAKSEKQAKKEERKAARIAKKAAKHQADSAQ